MARNKITKGFIPPVAKGLPLGALDSAVKGASMLDAMATMDYGKNLLAHALLQLQRDGWLNVKGSKGVESYPVGGIELKTEDHEWVVSFEVDGEWYEAFRENTAGPIHHTIHANGIKALVEGREGK